MPEIKKSSLGQKIAKLLDIPLDTVIDWPRVTLTANRSLVVQNHHGVIEYDQNIVRINTKLGELEVKGTGLSLVSAVKEEISVEGKITQVRLVDWR
ncbi:MAG TPA: YabP/YqfC family sporulation protein [Bacillota bacterium]|nr:YabP/YqfC family sporulation protein [Bacillota bacterium]